MKTIPDDNLEVDSPHEAAIVEKLTESIFAFVQMHLKRLSSSQQAMLAVAGLSMFALVAAALREGKQ
jgi:hypothetical protein